MNVHTLLNTVRLTDLLANLMRLQTHQKVLLNKQKKFQVQTLKQPVEIADGSSQLLPAIDEEGDDFSVQLGTNYFEQDLLDECQSNVGWLMQQFKPENDELDEILMSGITGFSYKERTTRELEPGNSINQE